MGYYIDQIAEQDRQKRLADLLAMQQDNIDPGVQYDTGIPDQRQQFLSALADPNNTIRTSGFDENFMRGEPYMQPQQAAPLPQNYIRNERTGAVTDLGSSQMTRPMGDMTQNPVDTPYGRGYYMKGDNTRVVLDNGKIVDLGRDTGRERAIEKENLGLQKQRAELARLQGKPVDPEVSKQSSLMRMYNSIPEGPMKQAFGEKHGFATKPEKRPDAELKKEAQMEGLGDAITQAKALLEGNAPGQKDLPTGSGIGSMWDALAGQVGSTPSGATEAQRMKVLGGALTSKMPRMEGPQSDKDTQLYREMAGLVGDDTVPIPRRLDALDQVSKLWLKYEKPKSAATAYDAAKESRYQEWKKARGM